jgi:hypothetical protein
MTTMTTVLYYSAAAVTARSLKKGEKGMKERTEIRNDQRVSSTLEEKGMERSK